jgi:hypothetical protein
LDSCPILGYWAIDSESSVVVNDDLPSAERDSLSSNLDIGKLRVDGTEYLNNGRTQDRIVYKRKLLPFIKKFKGLKWCLSFLRTKEEISLHSPFYSVPHQKGKVVVVVGMMPCIEQLGNCRKN